MFGEKHIDRQKTAYDLVRLLGKLAKERPHSVERSLSTLSSLADNDTGAKGAPMPTRWRSRSRTTGTAHRVSSSTRHQRTKP